MPSDESSNRQSVNTGLRSDRTTPAWTLVGCGRACKLLHLKRLKRFGMGPPILKRFYSCTIGCITAWYGNCSASDRKTLQRVVQTAQHIPAIQDLYTRRCQRKALKIVKDSCHPSQRPSLCYRTASGTGVPSLDPRGF